jgi:hypothetical protein
VRDRRNCFFGHAAASACRFLYEFEMADRAVRWSTAEATFRGISICSSRLCSQAIGSKMLRPYGACDFPGHIIDDLFDQTVRAGAYVAHDPDACRRGRARELIESAQQSLT